MLLSSNRRTSGRSLVAAQLTGASCGTSQAQQVPVSRKRVARLVQEEGTRGKRRRRYKCTTESNHLMPVAPNLLNRKFEAERPNQRWFGDTTELVIPGGKLYLAVLLDLISRIVMGWALSTVNDRHLTLRALEAALRRRCPDDQLLHHSDRGSFERAANKSRWRLRPDHPGERLDLSVHAP